MYYVGETYIGFDCDKCFFDTLEEAQASFEENFAFIVADLSRRLDLLREFSMQYDVEHWIIKDTTTGDIIKERTFALHISGKCMIK